MLREILKTGGLVLFFTLILIQLSGVVLAQVAGPREVLGLQDRLNENLNEEVLIRTRMSVALGVAARPYSAYLLHQKSLGLQGNRGRLQSLRAERAELIRMLEGLAAKSVVSEALLKRARQPSWVENMRRDSGSPMLSFQQARLVHAANASTEEMGSIDFYRVMMAGFLLVIFSLPFVVIFGRGEPIFARKSLSLVRVFPLFTINGAHGHREVLKIQLDV